MKLIRKIMLSAAEKRLLEERLYQEAIREVEAGAHRDGLWAKALADSKGNPEAARSLYLKYRVQSMLDEALIESERARMLDEALIESERAREPPLQAAATSSAHSEDVPAEEEISGEHWVCPGCGEKHEMQFVECWRCGLIRPEADSG